MTDPLSPLVADGIIDAVLSRLKSGKEADIYLVEHAGQVLAAKVYKDRQTRSFQNNAAYKEGRGVRNSRTQRAMRSGSRFGREADENAWKTKESDALNTLHAAGVRVPKPHLLYEGVLLMEVVVDQTGHPAPRLIDAHIPVERAGELYADLRRQIVSLLVCDLIHGDLSPYNVLLAWNGPTLIDFPQVIGAAHNSQAESFFRRDLETIRQFFLSKAPALAERAGDAQEIWRAYVRRELTPDFVPRVVPVAKPQARRDARGEDHFRKRRPGVPRAPGKHRPQQASAGGDGQSGPPRQGRPGTGNPGSPNGSRAVSPVVSYVGQPPQGQGPVPGAPGSKKRRRRRRRRGGSGPPPQA
jgi:RIO kinase 1